MAKSKTAKARTEEEANQVSANTTANNRPVYETRLGRVRCSVWQNPSENGPWYSVRVTRLYKVDDEWKASPSLNRDDLLPAAKLCEEAALWIFRQQREKSNELNPASQQEEAIPY